MPRLPHLVPASMVRMVSVLLPLSTMEMVPSPLNSPMVPPIPPMTSRVLRDLPVPLEPTVPMVLMVHRRPRS